MVMSARLYEFLSARHADYEVLAHPRTQSSSASAQAAHVPGRRFAKAVVLEDNEGYVLAVLPATNHLALAELGDALHSRPLRLARESELASLFPDCEPGALPALGAAYGLPTIIEAELDGQQELYFEAGDHEHMVHMSAAEFAKATAEVQRAHFSRIDAGLSRVSGGDTA
jgi:Ala-tRNA(Pro) deacylase